MKPRILIGIESLLPGGAEAFVIRLANGLSLHYEVKVFVMYADKINWQFVERDGRQFEIEAFKMPLETLIRKIDSLFLKLKLDIRLRDFFVQTRIGRLLSAGAIKVLHTNQFKVDYVFAQANKKYRIPHFTTIHGDYINFYERMRNGRLRILNYSAKVKMTLSQLRGIAYISDHQFHFVSKEFGANGVTKKMRKIYNGIENTLQLSDSVAPFSRKDFVFGMVARAIPEKGWECAIQAFLQLNKPGAQLVLVGEGEYLDALKKQYQHPDIYFAGYSNNPLSWISCFDVGLLPTTFPSESLPTTVIEYLLLGKPVIATDVGEIRNMISQNGASSGLLLPVQENRVSVHDCANAMKELVDDKDLYLKFAEAAKQHAKAFDMKTCIDNYLDFYRS